MPKFETIYGPVEAAEEPGALELELYGFLNGFPVGGARKADHFKAAARILWNKNTKDFVWHPWAEEMLEAACETKWLGLVGCGSCGKTDFAAIWGILNWLADVSNTKVLVTSTSLKESRKRIWGSICEYYQAAPGLPGKLVDSLGMIRTQGYRTKASDKCGIELIPGEKKKEREAIGKLIGMKNKRMIFIGDELPELSEALLSAAYSNLSLNPYFQFIGIGNFNSIFDPLGVFVKPKAGWASINPDSDRWETERGVCLRFDGIKSPNLKLEQDVWPIYGRRQLEEHRKLKENSIEWWRMCRSFPCPTGVEQCIYSEADFAKAEANREIKWRAKPLRLASLDPGFTNGGDRSIARMAELGQEAESGSVVLKFCGYETLHADATLADQPRNFQIARAFAAACAGWGVTPENAAVDSTGGGIPFCDIIDEVWSPRFLRVQFGGAASDLQVSYTDGRPGAEAYANRVTELWFNGLTFLLSRQIVGIDPDTARELCARRYDAIKSGQLRVRVESKQDMKSRLNFSPDLADAAMILVELARQRHGFLAAGAEGGRREADKRWVKTVQEADTPQPGYKEETEEDLPSPPWEDDM